ncbi:MAG: class I adenylate-forming enzyme family protein [Pseudomonadota bacterium]
MIDVPAGAIAHYTAAGAWGRQTFAGLMAALREKHPDREALVDAADRETFMGGAPRRLNYAQAWDEVRSLAAMLMAHGMKRDDVLCMQLPNCNEAVKAYLACALVGVVITPVPIQYREHELGHILGMTRARAIMTWRRCDGGANPQLERSLALSRLHPAADGTPATVLAWYTGDVPHAQAAATARAEGHVSLTPGCATASQLAVLDAWLSANTVDANETFALCWTSGTEGLPKGVPRSHNQWLIAPRAVAEACELADGVRMLNPFPLTNPGSLSGMVGPWLLTGGTLVQHQPFNLEVFLRQLREEAIDYTCATPALLASLLQNEELARQVDFTRLRHIASGAAPLSEWMVRGFAEKFGVHIVNCYGSSEGAALYSSHRDVPDPGERAQYFPRMGSPGFASRLTIAQWLQSRLVDAETGETIEAPGRPGELRVKGPNVFHGYYKAPELSAAAFDEQGYYRTGDVFEIAGARNEFYRFVGRTKDIVIRGGMNISSAEVENLIQGHPKVRETAVIGWPDERLGERVCAVVVPRDGESLTLEELVAWLREHGKMAVYKLPERLLLSDGLPRNPTGKVLKRELRRLLPAQA